MRILIDSYNTVMQLPGGGVQKRIKCFSEALCNNGCEVKLYDKWTDRLENFDVLHVFKTTVDDYNLICFAKKMGIKVVMSSIIPLSGSFNIRANLLLSKLLPIHTFYNITQRELDLCDYIFTESNAESDFISKNYNISLDKISALPNGFDSNILSIKSESQELELPFDGNYVLQVGRFDCNKNQINVIKALNGTNVPLVLVGGPDPNSINYYQECQRIADSNVHFTGWIGDSSQLAKIYSSAKVLILPSYHETFGNVVIEGGINNCVLACSKNLPICEWDVIKPYIHTFDPYSEADIRSTVKECLCVATPYSADVFSEFFSWDRIAREHIKIYKRLLSEN